MVIGRSGKLIVKGVDMQWRELRGWNSFIEVREIPFIIALIIRLYVFVKTH